MRIGILTGGGDAPGLNAAIRAVVLRATALGHETFGIGDGWAGLLGEAAPRVLVSRDVAAILGEGGTILGTSRTDPRKDDASRRAVLDGIRRFRLDALVAVGGNDTLGVAQWLHEQGVAVVGVPKTVDNDLAETDFCIGFDTQTAVARDAFGHIRLDQRAIGAVLARHIEQRTGIEARQVVLGHLQRGGSPTAVDRLRATRFGNAAADLAIAGRSGVLPVQRGGRIEVATLADALHGPRALSDDIIELVRRFAGILD